MLPWWYIATAGFSDTSSRQSVHEPPSCCISMSVQPLNTITHYIALLAPPSIVMLTERYTDLYDEYQALFEKEIEGERTQRPDAICTYRHKVVRVYSVQGFQVVRAGYTADNNNSNNWQNNAKHEWCTSYR